MLHLWALMPAAGVCNHMLHLWALMPAAGGAGGRTVKCLWIGGNTLLCGLRCPPLKVPVAKWPASPGSRETPAGTRVWTPAREVEQIRRKLKRTGSQVPPRPCHHV